MLIAAEAAIAQTWQSQDVGLVAAAGSSSESGGVVMVRGSGSDVWDTVDEFHFRHQTLSEDGEVVVRVNGVDNTHPWAKAGIMMRVSLQANSPNVFLFVTPNGEVCFQDRFTTGSATNFRSMAYGSFPVWLRVVRRGHVYTAYYSQNGTTWQGGLSASPGGLNLVGLGVTSHNDGTLCAAPFDNVQVLPSSTTPPPVAPSGLVIEAFGSSTMQLRWSDNSSDETGFQIERSANGTNFAFLTSMGQNSVTYTDTGLASNTSYFYRVRAMRGGIASGYSNVANGVTASGSAVDFTWHNQDIGNVAASGGTSISEPSTRIGLAGSGADVWSTADECYFRYKTISGDGEVETAVVSIDNTDPAAKVGVMLRASLDANAPNVFLCFKPSFAADFQYRASAGGATIVTGETAWLWPDTRLRVVRQGNQFSAYANEHLIGTATVAMPETVYAGFAVTSHRDGVVCNTTLSGPQVYVAAWPSPPPAPTGIRVVTTNTSSERSFWVFWDYTPTRNTWFDVEVSHDGVNFGSNGGWNYFSAQPGLTYYFRVRARVSGVWSGYSNIISASIPYDEGGGPPTPPSNLTATALSSTEIRLNWTDNSSNETGFRIFRRRDGFIETHAATAANATTYTDSGLEPGTAYVYDVYAIGSSSTNGAATASATTQPPATPPPPLQSADIGGPSAAGQVVVSGDTVTVRGSGDDIWNTSDEFQFYSREFTGDGDIVVRLNSMENTHSSAKAGLMLRASNDPDAANLFLYVTPDFRLGVQIRYQNGQATQLPKISQWAAPLWLRLTRTGNTVMVQFSSDQVNWGFIDSYTINLPATIRAGIAVTSHNDGTLCAATFNNFRIYRGISSSPPPPPPPPPPATWTRTEIGTQGVASTSTELSAGAVTVSGAGTDIWDRSDGFVFFNRPLSGNGSITVRVSSMANTHAWAKAGVMIRSDLTHDAKHVFAYVTPANGAGVHARAEYFATTTNAAGPWWISAPYFLRVTRSGNTFAAHGSPDGTTWTLISTETATMPNDVFVGLAVTSHDPSQLNEVRFTDLSL